MGEFEGEGKFLFEFTYTFVEQRGIFILGYLCSRGTTRRD